MLKAVTTGIAVAALFCPARAGAQDAPRRISLDDAVAMFAANSRALQATRAEARALAAMATATGQTPNPTFGTTRESIRHGDAQSGETYVTVNQTLRWPWAASARRTTIRRATSAGEAAVRADSLAMVHGVRMAFVDAWMAERRHAVLTRVAEVVRQAQARGAERFRRGDISGLDLGRLDLERIRYDRLVAAGRLAVDSTRRTLGASILAPADHAPVAPEPLPPRAPIPAFDTVGAIAAHPAVRHARAELALAAAEARAQSALVLPGPTLTAGYKWQDDGLSGLYVGASVPVPLLDRRSGARGLAAAHVAAAEARVAMAERHAMDQARHAIARHAAALRLADSVEAIAEPRDLVAIALAAYEEGELDLTDLLATAAAWRELGTLADESHAEYWLSRFELERALAGAAAPTDAMREAGR